MFELSFGQLGLSFLEGLGLIVSPCILPILPLVLATSLDGGRARPIGIITGFITAFSAFSLLSRQIFSWLHVDTEIVRQVALVFLMLLGASMLSQKLSDLILTKTQKLAEFGQKITARWDQKQGFLSGVAIGLLIGLVWTPCAGPILAAAVVQIIQAKTNLEAILSVILFALGAGIPMLAIALAGRNIMIRFEGIKKHTHIIRQVLGGVIIVAALLIYSGADVRLLAATGGPVKSQDDTRDASPSTKARGLQDALSDPYTSPEIADSPEWINSPSLKIADLKGKVVLIDFWTYSCINCVRTLPYLTQWDVKYREKGLVIIGVHSPEFEFEKKYENVRKAVQLHGIHYPVVLDSRLETWSNFKNQYWPAHYLIDKQGRVVYTHFGEGNYDITENNIRALLGMGPEDLRNKLAVTPSSSVMQTPELYLGYARALNFVSVASTMRGAVQTYSFPSFIGLHQWGLSGDWLIGSEFITSQKADAALRLNFISRKVFLVLGTKDGKPVSVKILLNGQPVGDKAGADVKDGVVTVDRETLYELVDQREPKNGLLELQASGPNLQAYAFTFGE